MIELSQTKQNIYKESCPIIIKNGTVFKDEDKLFAMLEIKSISSIPITSIMVDLHVFNRANNEVEVIRDYMYLTDNLERGQEFGSDTLIELSAPSSLTLAIAIRRIVFSDDNIWDGSNSILFEALPELKTIEEELEEEETVAQYKRDFNNIFAEKKDVESLYVPSFYKDLWFCSCGEINHNYEEKCFNCGAMYIPQQEHIFNRVQLASNLEDHKKYLIKKAEEERLEKERLEKEAEEKRLEEERLALEEKERQIRIIKHKKRIRIMAISISIPVAIAIMVYIYILNVYLIPNQKYNDAMGMLSSEQYDEAISTLESLNGYSDSAFKIHEVNFAKAKSLLEDGNLDEAITIFESIKDKINVTEFLNQAYYQKALIPYNESDFVTAIELLTPISGYSDVDDLLLNANYQLALLYTSEGNFEASIPYFEKLSGTHSTELQAVYFTYAQTLYTEGNTEEAEKYFAYITSTELAAQVNELHYQTAVALLAEGKFDEASVIFTELGDYSDSKTQVLGIEYAKAEELFNAGLYSEAIPQYEKAGDYPGALDKINESYYQIALKTLNDGEYIEASEKFTALGDYRDSATKADEAIYRLGSEQLNNGDVVDAYNTLYAIKDYLPALQLLGSNSLFYIYIYDPGNGPNPLYE